MRKNETLVEESLGRHVREVTLSCYVHSDNSVYDKLAFVNVENKAALFLRPICSMSLAFRLGMQDAS